MNFKYAILTATLLFWASLFSLAQKPKPFKDGEVVLTPSWIQERQQLNTGFLRSLDPDRLLHNFRVNAGLPSDAQPLEGWEDPGCGLRGHFTGHYLSALATVVAKTGDPQLKARLDYMVDELAKCQRALGTRYLSAFSDKDFDTLEQTGGGVWAPYYTYHKIMQGLLDAYTKTGNEQALHMAIDMADYAYERMEKLTPEQIERMLYTAMANPGNEAGGMNDVLYQLYVVTGDKNHLALARVFDRDWFLKPLASGKDILSGLHSNTHLPLVIGFTRAYDIDTTQKKYRDAAVNFWDILMNHHAYANGTNSGPRPNPTTQTSLTAEHWTTSDVLSTTLTREIAESCVSHNTQRLTSRLFEWTADPMYADAFMNLYYNGVLAAQNGHSGEVVYHLPLGSPRKKKWLNSEEDFRCCNGSSLEAFASLDKGIYYHDGNNLWVNLYVPSTVDLEGIKVEQTGDILREGKVTLKLEKQNEKSKDKSKGKRKSKSKHKSKDKDNPLGQYAINLYIPFWSSETMVRVNDRLVDNPLMGNFYQLKRNWNDGDEITVELEMEPYYITMLDAEDMVAFFYGPMMLAFSSDQEIHLHGSAEDVVKTLRRVDANTLTFKLQDGKDTYMLRPLFDITNEPYSVYVRTQKL